MFKTMIHFFKIKTKCSNLSVSVLLKSMFFIIKKVYTEMSMGISFELLMGTFYNHSKSN